MSKKNVKYPEIKKSICEREHTSRSVHRAAIRDSKGMDRWAAWNDKRDYGRDTRHLLLTYGMLRGFPYVACEPKCGEFNYPSVMAIVTLAQSYGHKLEIEAVKAWIAARPAAPEVVEGVLSQEEPPKPAEPKVQAPTAPIPAQVPGKPGIFARLFGKTA